MIWFNLALFAASFVLTALLSPRPQIENARAQELDPESFPRASENAPVTLLLGCGRIRAPNTLYYGDFEAVPITKRQQTGLFSSKRVTIGYDYYLTLDLGLCLGPCELKEIYIDSEPVDPGIDPAFDPDFAYVNEEAGGTTNWSGSTFNFQTGTLTFSESYGAGFAASGRGFTRFELLADFPGLTEALIDGEGLTLEVEMGANANSTIGSDKITVVMAVRFRETISGSEIFSPDGPSAQTLTAQRDQGTGPWLFNFDCTIPAGARFMEVVATHTMLFPIFAGQAFGDHRITIRGANTVYTTQSFAINEPELFGGRERGGGVVGDATFYPGTFDQDQDPDIQASLGVTDIPAYRGMAHIVLPNNYIGESPQLRRMEFLIGRITNNLGTTTGGLAFTGSPDINPAEALYTMLTDEWSGLSIPAAKVNVESFRTAAETLITEQHGCTIIVSGSQQGRDVHREVLKQIDGVYAQNQAGEIELRLIRDDYVAASLPVYDEDDIVSIDNYRRTSWRDVFNVVKASFQDRDKDGQRIAEEQNMAVLNMIGQRRVSEVSFPFCYDAALAQRLAARELSRLSIPIISFTATMKRSAFQLSVGDVVKVTWPEYGITELIVRVQRVNLGRLQDNRVIVEFVQDRFAASTTTFAPPAVSSWTSDRVSPVTVATAQIVEQPFFLASRLDFPAEDGFGAVIPFALRPQVGSSGFSFNHGVATGDLGFFDPNAVSYGVTGLLTAPYGRLEGFETGLDAAGFTIGTVSGTPTAAATASIRAGEAGLIWVGGEWMGYEGVTNNGNGTFTLGNVRRGLFGTRPLAHDAGARVWFLSVELLGDGESTGTILEDDQVFYKLLDIAGGTQRSSPAVTEQDFTLSDLADRPLRPRNLQIDGSRAEVPFNGTATPMFDLTWVSSNRAAEQVAFEADSSETPDQAETYDLEVWIDGVQDMSLSATGISSPYAVDLTGATGVSGELRVYSRRTGGDTKRSAYYAFYPFSLSITMDSIDTTLDQTDVTMDQT